MTIASTTSFNRYAGNDVATVFPYTFKLSSEDHLEVIIADADDVQTTLTLNVHFELTGVGEANGGDVTALDLTSICGQAALPTGWTLVAHRVPPATQLTDLVNQGGFFAEVHEQTFDYLTMLVQHLQEQIALCPQVSLTSGLTGDALPAMIADVDAALTASELAQTAAELAQSRAELAQSRAETAAAAAELAAEEFEIASEAEAIAGTNNTKSMSSLRVKQSITSQIASQAEAEAGTDNTKLNTPLKTFQAVKALHAKSNPTNLLPNGDFEAWSAGAAAAPDGWQMAGAGMTVARWDVSKDPAIAAKIGTYHAQVTRSGNDGFLGYYSVHASKGINYWKGRTITLGCWVYATVANRALLYIYDGVGTSTSSSFHTGDSTWQWLTVTRTIDLTATAIRVQLQVQGGAASAYFDGAMCVEGSSAFAFSPKPLTEQNFIDDDTMATASASNIASAESMKAYIDGKSGMEVFTADGTFTAKTTQIFVTAVGGGGGGGRRNMTTGGGGGGGGQTILRYPVTVVVGNTYAVVVGKGGAGRTGSVGYGTAGGNTTFATTTIVALGGAGGADNGAGGLGGGRAAGVDVLDGKVGFGGNFLGGGNGGTSTADTWGGGGGASLFGSGGGAAGESTAGSNGTGYGAGGSAGGVSKDAGSGTDGIVIIEY